MLQNLKNTTAIVMEITLVFFILSEEKIVGLGKRIWFYTLSIRLFGSRIGRLYVPIKSIDH
jgi:hypothetical protein